MTVSFGGNEYTATAEMAAIFLHHALETIDRGTWELVPLRHLGGVELLVITPDAPLHIGSVEPRLQEVSP
ncbi:hypothetical protein BH09ACT3_BH09ACT3_09270 [soil metagenome]